MQATLNKTKSKSFSIKRRRDLLPGWIKFFIFLFLFLGALGLSMSVVRNIMGSSLGASTIYGLETNVFFSWLGLFINSIMLFKAVVSYGLWMEKDWAVKFGIMDAVFGIIVCTIVMVVLPFVDFEDGINKLNIRFEIFLLVPYLYKLVKIKKEWGNFIEVAPVISTVKENIQNETFTEKTSSVDIKPETENKMEEKIDKEDPSRFMPK
jgi:magnesium-transporting ATPase (P-type)